MVGWIILGLLAVGAATAIVVFWDKIKDWLNNTAANFVERHLGFNARQNMLKATAVVDRVAGRVRNITTVFTKKTAYSPIIEKITMESFEYEGNIDNQVLDEIRQKGKLVQTFEYRS